MKKKILILLVLAGCFQQQATLASISKDDRENEINLNLSDPMPSNLTYYGSSTSMSPLMNKRQALQELYKKQHDLVEAYFGKKIRGYTDNAAQIARLEEEIAHLERLPNRVGMDRNQGGENRGTTIYPYEPYENNESIMMTTLYVLKPDAPQNIRNAFNKIIDEMNSEVMTKGYGAPAAQGPDGKLVYGLDKQFADTFVRKYGPYLQSEQLESLVQPE